MRQRLQRPPQTPLPHQAIRRSGPARNIGTIDMMHSRASAHTLYLRMDSNLHLLAISRASREDQAVMPTTGNPLNKLEVQRLIRCTSRAKPCMKHIPCRGGDFPRTSHKLKRRPVTEPEGICHKRSDSRDSYCKDRPIVTDDHPGHLQRSLFLDELRHFTGVSPTRGFAHHLANKKAKHLVIAIDQTFKGLAVGRNCLINS